MDTRSSSLQPLAVQPREITIAKHSLATLDHHYKCSRWLAAPFAVQPQVILTAKPSLSALEHH
jgi:hypothetical protein